MYVSRYEMRIAKRRSENCRYLFNVFDGVMDQNQGFPNLRGYLLTHLVLREYEKARGINHLFIYTILFLLLFNFFIEYNFVTIFQIHNEICRCEECAYFC